MESSIIAVFIFWCAFGFSVGPFWISVMQAVNETQFKNLCLQFTLYQIFCWFPLVVAIALITGILGGINQSIFIALHLIGMAVILFLSYQIVRSKIKKIALFKFGFKEMSLLSITNPKVWVMVPIGSLAAEFGENIWINSLLFFAIGLPIFSIAFLFWAGLGKLGNQISSNKISYINAAMLTSFALYIGYQGVVLLTNPLATQTS